MTTTALKIITKAMQKAGIVTKTETIDADEANDALDALNAMLSSWSNDSMMIYARSWEFFNLVGGQAQYLIGPGAADFDTVHPIDIVEAYIRVAELTDYDVAIVNDEIYTSQITLKSAPGIPEWLNYDNNFPIATIKLFPVPPTAYQLFILSEKILSQFALEDEVNLPPGWERMLVYNLAVEIAPDYDQEVPASVQSIAVMSKSLVKKAIMKNRSLDAYPKEARPNNIFSGWNR